MHADKTASRALFALATMEAALKTSADVLEFESLRKLVALHAEQTGSSHAKALVVNWPAEVLKFWKVVPFPPTADTPKPCYRFENFAQSLGTPVSPV